MTIRKRIDWQQVTALFGGTFDPPHVGHETAVTGLFKEPGVQRVVVLPAAIPPHKKAAATPEQRVEMARLAFSGGARGEVLIDTREIERARLDGRPSFSFDTIQECRREWPELAFVIGTDQLAALPGWYRFHELLSLCHWIVLERKPEGSETARKVLSEWLGSGLIRAGSDDRSWVSPGGTELRLTPTEAPAWAAREIREAIQRSGAPPQGALSPAVFSYLKTHRLYGSA